MTRSRKQLFLLRHAKSSWDDPSLDDHDRPLAPRGRKAAKTMAEHVLRERIRPSLVLCSSAQRTRETLDRVSPPGEVLIEPELYGATEDGLLERLRRVPSTVGSVMLIGHNPGMEDLAVMLAGSGIQLPEIKLKFPTAALATLAFEGEWSNLRPGCAELAAFVTPRELG